MLGLEQFTPAHDRGSSHGESRIIRQAYFEGAEYVPLLLRAYELWDDLERDDPGLFLRTGGLMIGRSGSTDRGRFDRERRGRTASPTRCSTRPRSARASRSAAAGRRRRAVRGGRGLRAPRAGGGPAAGRRGPRPGADLRFEDGRAGWSADGDGVRVTTADGATHRADRLVVTAGAWAPRVLADLGLPLVVERQVLYWFRTAHAGGRSRPSAFPVFIWEQDDGLQLYGFPTLPGADEVKVSFFRRGGPTDPDELDREVHADEIAVIRGRPAGPGARRRGRVPARCGVHVHHHARRGLRRRRAPGARRTWSWRPGFSGHGFKFTPVIGEILADLATDGVTAHPVGLFDPARFARSRGPRSGEAGGPVSRRRRAP